MNLRLKPIAAFIILLGITFISCRSVAPQPPETSGVITTIDSLIVHKNFFAARELYQDKYSTFSEFERLKVGIFLDHAFNRSNSSAYRSEAIFSQYEDRLSDSLKYEIEALAHINYSREYDYKKATESLEQLLSNYKRYIPEDEKKELQNTLIIWDALKEQPQQKITKQERLETILAKDKAGLQNLKISTGDVETNFIFDTGANISTITETTAKELGVEILPVTFDVDAITGNKIKSKIGVAPKLNLGPIVIENAVFLIFPDDALAFPQIDYQIHGILGFPVLEAMDEIQITRDGRFIVPVEPTTSGEKNLALDFLTPLLYLQEESGAGVFTFDTGATTTMLYNTYLQLHQERLKDAAPETDYTFGGAGGAITKKGIYTSFSPLVNGKTIAIDSVIVLKEEVTPDNYFLGNVGQDLIRKFEKMIINFNEMFIRFE